MQTNKVPMVPDKTKQNKVTKSTKKQNIKRGPEQAGTMVRLIGSVDIPFLLITLALLGIGTIMVFSASYSYANTRFNDLYFFVRRQLGWMIFSISIMIIIAKIADYRWLKRWAYIGYIGVLGLNFLVPAIGYAAGGAKRWVDLGFVNFQPSELMKLFVIIALAAYASDNKDKMDTFKGGVLPFIYFGAPAAASIIIQVHLSATIIIILLVVTMMIIGGTGRKWIAATFGAIAGLAAFTLTVGIQIIEKLVPHALVRLKVWEDPFAYMKDELTNDAGWQPAQSLLAISSGGFWGVGLLNSVQKHGYLPEPQNDYIFAILCEELGFFGATVVIGLFAAFVWRGYKISKAAPNRFSSLLVMGLVFQVAFQVILNIAVVTNVLPSTGIGLPFFSYGGTSLSILMAEVGIILSISRYSIKD